MNTIVTILFVVITVIAWVLLFVDLILTEKKKKELKEKKENERE